MVCTYSYYPSSYYSGKGEPQDQLHNLWEPCAKWKCNTSCSKTVDKQLQDRNSRAWHQVQISSEPRALCNRTHPHLWSRSWCRSDVPGLLLHDRGSYPSLPHQEAASINHPRLPFTWLLISASHYQPHTNKAFFQPQFFHRLSCRMCFKMY